MTSNGLLSLLFNNRKRLENYLPNIVKHQRFYSTAMTNISLNPYWVTGFIDAEGCFLLRVSRNRTVWAVGLAFVITLHKKDLELLKRIQSFFGVGTININETQNTATYTVQSVKNLANVIIPHLQRFPLITQKRADYDLFKTVVDMFISRLRR